MNNWTDSQTKAALQRFLREGSSHDWETAVESAEGESLLLAFAEQLQQSNEQELILLRKLAPDAARRRPELLKCFNKRVVGAHGGSEYGKVLTQLLGLIEEGTPKPGSREDVEDRINGRVEAGCRSVGISGRVRRDLLAAVFEEEALGGRPLAKVLDMSDDEVKEIARNLSRLANPTHYKPQKPPASKRARLMAQAAKILLVAPQPEDRAIEIKRAIGSYCCRQAQVYAQDRREIDAAQDYALEAVRYQHDNREFPAGLYFYTAEVQFEKQRGSDTIPPFLVSVGAEEILRGRDRILVPASPYRDSSSLLFIEREQFFRFLGLALLRLALCDHSMAFRLFRKLTLPVQTMYAHVLTTQLGARSDSSKQAYEQFEGLLEIYRARMISLHETLGQAAQVRSPKEIGSFSTKLGQLTTDARLLVSFGEQGAIKEIAQAAVRAGQASKEDNPAVRRSQFKAALEPLRRAKEHGHSLSFGILFIEPIVEEWTRVIERGIEETQQLIRPELSLKPYKNTLLRRGQNGSVQLQLHNAGKGVATAIDVQGRWLDVTATATLEHAHLNPGQEALLTLDGPLASDMRHVQVRVALSCSDAEGAQVSFPEWSWEFTGAPPDFDFDEKRGLNPFNAGDIVKDPDMFMGREAILNLLQNVVTADAHRGALRLLFGQKRVGKSSILYFLEQQLREFKTLPVICAG